MQKCWVAQAASHGREDLHMLPLLLRAAAGQQQQNAGTFIEIGAFDGTSGSQTLLFERCHGWRGVLVEASPPNFEKLRRSNRTAHMVHAAAASCSPSGTAEVSIGGNEVAGVVDQTPKGYRYSSSRGQLSAQVPCKPLLEIAAEKMPHVHQFTYLSLDVEGLELSVLQGMGELSKLPFLVLLVENTVPTTQNHIKSLLKSSGFHKLNPPLGFGIRKYSQNDVWVASSLLGTAQDLFGSTALQGRGKVGNHRLSATLPFPMVAAAAAAEEYNSTLRRQLQKATIKVLSEKFPELSHTNQSCSQSMRASTQRR